MEQEPLDNGQLPSVVEEYVNVTVPVGVPLLAVTVAFRVTVAPAVAELGLAVTDVVVLTDPLVTVTLTAVDVDVG